MALVQTRHDFMVVDANNRTISTASVSPVNGHLVVGNVWTDADHRRKGLATEVMRAVVDAYQDRVLWLHVMPYTDQALRADELIQWYEKFGFVLQNEVGTMKREGWRK
jgi:ribosomal protein S18 acetylase RimI-like enzyme